MKRAISVWYFVFLAFISVIFDSSGYSVNTNIKIDQFGYRPLNQKIAVISNPQTGYNSANTFSPGTTYEVRRLSDNVSVFTAAITPWNSGATHSQSGDKVWWFDFSSVTIAGTYYVFDATNNVGSNPFVVSDCIYNGVLKHAMRSYYYQRCGFAKTPAFAGIGWADGASHVGPQQDTDCRLYNNTLVGTSKNLSGGWFDAGDYNKYVNFTWSALTDLLLAYEEAPTVWTDDYNIPESGNGTPDVLDEIKYEMDWLLKMQQSDGSVLSLIGGGSASPPSADLQPRRYGPATTSASLTFASVCALAAIQFKSVGLTTYATTLQKACVKAYAWAITNPGITFYNQPNHLAAGEQEFPTSSYTYDVLCRQIGAATFLYALTGTNSYRTYVEANYDKVHMVNWGYAYPFETTAQDILLYFAKLPGVTATVTSTIRNAYSNSMITGNKENLVNFTNQMDAYRAYLSDANYTWGSNSVKAGQGNMFANMNVYGLNTANTTNYKNAASGFMHYIHGVNPNGIVYLSNMSLAGAAYSVREFYHGWFNDGSKLWDRVGVSTYGPAPGYLVGGPNPSYNWDACCPNGCGANGNNSLCVTLSPPKNQPVQKSFLEFNSNWPLNSWQITENGIYYQAAYIRLLSKFCSSGCDISSPTNLNRQIFPVEIVKRNEFRIFPNPSSDLITLDLNLRESYKTEVIIDDTMGKLKYHQFFNSNDLEVNKFELSILDLPIGIYNVTVRTPKNQSVQKLVKL